MNPKLMAFIEEALPEFIDQVIPVDGVHETIEDLIEMLQFRFSVLGYEQISQEDYGYCALLMAVNQAYSDGIADKMVGRVATVVREMYEAGELPEESAERIRQGLEETEQEREANGTV